MDNYLYFLPKEIINLSEVSPNKMLFTKIT